ncbi:MAG: Tm-1-like ATP-binding domain-containing protein [Syntrophorhabdales bacterium]|jgi:uncharacterized protein (UPF0261 family)
MLNGAKAKMLDLLANREVDGVVALGGASMAIFGSHLMRVLPFGVPKVIATPAAMPAYLDKWFDAMDVQVMQVIMEFTGMNGLLKNAIGQVAGVISGAVEESLSYTSLKLPARSVAITEIGFTPACSHQVTRLMQAGGYNVFPFHAQGISERAMEKLIDQGFFEGVIDIVPAGVIEEMFGGNRAAGKERLDAFARKDIPLVLAPSCINLTGSGPTRKNREKYAAGPQWKMDELRSMTRYPTDDLRQAASVYAEKLNKAKGPVRVVAPLKGWSAIDREGSALYNPTEDRIFIDELVSRLDGRIGIVEVPCNLEDVQFAEALIDNLKAIFDR